MVRGVRVASAWACGVAWVCLWAHRERREQEPPCGVAWVCLWARRERREQEPRGETGWVRAQRAAKNVRYAEASGQMLRRIYRAVKCLPRLWAVKRGQIHPSNKKSTTRLITQCANASCGARCETASAVACTAAGNRRARRGDWLIATRTVRATRTP